MADIFQSVSPADQAQGGAVPRSDWPINTMPGAGPQMPGGSPQFDIIGTVQRLLQMPQFQQPSQELSDIGAREKGVSQQMEEMSKPENMPQRRYQPNYEHGAGVGGAARNVGRGVLQGLSFTGPGQNIQNAIYEPGIKAYEQKKGALAGELASIKGEEETAKEKMQAATGLTGAASLGAYRGGQLEATNRKIDIMGMNAQTRALADQHKTALGADANRIREEIGKGRLTVEQARTQMENIISQRHDTMMRDISSATLDKDEAVSQQRAAEQDFATESNHVLQNLLGLGPTKPVTPAGGRPTTARPNQMRNKTDAQPQPQKFSHVSSDGKWGWDGKAWIATPSAGR